jgi:hypothetical protein
VRAPHKHSRAQALKVLGLGKHLPPAPHDVHFFESSGSHDEL